MRVRIKEARKKYKETTGVHMTMRSLARLAMPDSSASVASKADLLYRMQRGELSHPSLELIERIALVCGVDYNFLIVNDN